MTLSDSTFILPKAAELTRQQRQVKDQILAFATNHLTDEKAAVFVLNGDAGSGKSAVLSTVFNELQKASKDEDSVLYKTDNHLLVNHNEMLKIYWEIAVQTKFLHKKDFQKPTPFINQMVKNKQQADIVFVDEAQLLLSQADPFNHFRAENQLEELLKLTKVLVIAVDFKQVVKLKSYWSKGMLLRHLARHAVQTMQLKQQLRMQDQKVAEWIDAFVAGKLLPLPQTREYDLQIFPDGQPLFSWVKQHDKQSGLARVLATTDFPFRVYSKEPWYVTAGTLKLPWDRFNYQTKTWASQPQTLNEVGSIYTIQGFDLNYAGVILGPSITYDKANDCIVISSDKFEDQTAFQKRHANDIEDIGTVHVELIRNVVNILLKRGRYGLGLYAVDSALRKRLLELADINSK